MGASQARQFVPPVRYSVFDMSLDLTFVMQERLTALRSERTVSLVCGTLATILTVAAILTPCWYSSAAQKTTVGLFTSCYDNKCNTHTRIPFLLGFASFLAVLLLAGQFMALYLHWKALTKYTIVAWNVMSFVYLLAGVLTILLTVGATVELAPFIRDTVFFGFSYFLSWIGGLLACVKGGVDFYLSHKYVHILCASHEQVRDFSQAENSAEQRSASRTQTFDPPRYQE